MARGPLVASAFLLIRPTVVPTSCAVEDQLDNWLGKRSNALADKYGTMVQKRAFCRKGASNADLRNVEQAIDEAAADGGLDDCDVYETLLSLPELNRPVP